MEWPSRTHGALRAEGWGRSSGGAARGATALSNYLADDEVGDAAAASEHRVEVAEMMFIFAGPARRRRSAARERPARDRPVQERRAPGARACQPSAAA